MGSARSRPTPRSGIWMVGRVLLVLLALAAAGLMWLARQGIGATSEPSAFETAAARQLRRWAIPASARDRSNPVEAGQPAFEAALAHYADHCAVCHGADGSGRTPIGSHLYPRTPDMRRPETQALTDGELFFIIENGVKLTGMPAWTTGTPEGERQSWQLVRLIRRLPSLGAADVARIGSLMPRTPDEWRRQQEEEDFLQGGTPDESGHGAPHD